MLGLGGGSSPLITNMHNQGSMLFNGSDESVNIDAIAGQFNGNTFSASMWCQVATTSTSGFLFRIMVGTDTDNQMLVQYHASGNEIRANSKFGGTADVLNQGSNSVENDGLWHHVVFILDKTGDNKTYLYVDNSLKEEIAGVGTLSGAFSKMSIGQNTADGSFWKGSIDEVAFWSRAITPSEVALIYGGGSSGGGGSSQGIDLAGQLGKNLVGYFRFEEKGGTVAANSGTGGYDDGTYVNTPTFQSIHS